MRPRAWRFALRYASRMLFGSAPALRLALALALLAGCGIWLARGEVFTALARLTGRTAAQAETFADVGKAYGPTFYYFALMFAAAVMLAAALRDAEAPYADERQRLLRG